MPGVVQTMVVILNAVPVTDGEQLFDTWDGLVLAGEEVEPTLDLFEFRPPITPPTIAPTTVKTARPITAHPFFVCQKG